jgi:hypothetical protein
LDRRDSEENERASAGDVIQGLRLVDVLVQDAGEEGGGVVGEVP